MSLRVPMTATHSNTNQVATWNGVSSSFDAASNITKNPQSGAQYKWDSRNMLAQQTTAPTMTFTYDALGRRTSLNSPPANYVYDGGDVIRSIVNPGVLATTSDFARVPGSGEVMEATVAGGTTPGTWVPLHDASGSTIALVDPSSGAINTQYSYDPSGMVGTIGAANSYPFLYAGMEYDGATGLYHTGSNYYSLQLTRPASEVGPMPSHTSGNPTSPSDIAGFSGGGGSNPFSPTRNLQNAGIAIGAGVGAAALTAGGLAVLGLSESLGWIAGPVGGAVALAVDLALFFDDLFGGGSSIPYQLLYPGHSPEGLVRVGWQDSVDQNPVYHTIDDAVRGASRAALALSRKTGNESFGTVVRAGTGYTYTNPVDVGSPYGGRVSVPGSAVATYHTHPATCEGGVPELLSPRDRDFVALDPLHRPLYYITPPGEIYRYSGGDGPPVALQR